MIITWDKADKFLRARTKMIPCSCFVRNELNGLRKKEEVIYTIPGEMPYMPRPFPNGEWIITRPRARSTPYLAPFYIPTTAQQEVDVWELRDNKYFKPSGIKATDTAYGLHYSTSSTTQGCIKILDVNDLLWLVNEIQNALDSFEPVKIVVSGELKA